MDLAQARHTLEDALAPATADLDRQQSRAAFRVGLFAGVQTLPRFAAVLTLGWLGASYVAGAPLFEPLALPLILAVVPLASALSFRAATRRQTRIDARTAALVLDRNNGTKDRLSAAFELSGDPESAGDDRRAALARAAVDDGVVALRRVDLARTEVPVPRLRMSWASLMFALLLALVPAALRFEAGGAGAPGAGTPLAAAGDSRDQSADRAPDAEERRDEPATEPRADARAEPKTTAPREAERRPDREQPRPDAAAEAQKPRGAGAGAAGAEATGERGQRAPTAGDTKTANSGAASQSGQGGGGQGSAKSDTPSEEQQKAERREQKPKATAPRKPSSTEGGDQEKSAGNPSGPSRGGGKMAAVGNQRSGLERGRDRDDDPDTDDEDVEDEKEETEQRGGVMPMTRDRMRAAGRELSISGNGPPGDGRGGPTPPKKSRGTASLVLGIRLPDQIRGQPNPGTAKTTIEQIPPVPQDEAPRPATPAPSAGPSHHVQSAAVPLGDLAEAVRRYHEMLRGTAQAPAPDSTRDE